MADVDGQQAIYWRSSAEQRFRLIPGTEDAGSFGFSPDGAWIVFGRGDALLKVDFSGALPTPQVFADRRRDALVAVKSVDDGTPPQVLLNLDGGPYPIPTQWPRDDLLLFELHDKGGSDLLNLDMAGDTAVMRPYLESEADLSGMKISPDGTLAAYSSDESDQREVYVRGFPRATQPQRVSVGGGSSPISWSRNGDRIYYWVRADEETASLVAATIHRGPPFSVTHRDTLFTGRYPDHQTDLHPDGDRLVVARPMTDADPTAGERERFLVVVSWFEELRARMGGG